MEFTKEQLELAIKNATLANNEEDARALWLIYNEKFPDQKPELKAKTIEYTEEQKAKNLDNQAKLKVAEHRQTIENSKHLGNIPIQAGLNSFVSGYIFAGESMDEMVGAVHGEEAMEKTRLLQEAFAKQHPNWNTGLRVGGAIASSIPLGSIAATQKLYKFIQGLPPLWRYATAMGTGGTFGLTEGTVSGAGIQGADETGGQNTRLENAATRGMSGALWGTIGGGAAQGVTDVASIAWTRLKHGLKDRSLKDIVDLFGVSRKAAHIIRDTVTDIHADYNSLVQKLKLGGSQGQIPDADEAITVVLDAIAASGGQGASQVSHMVGDRLQVVSRGVESSLNRNIAKLEVDESGIPLDAIELKKIAAQQSSPQRTRAYKKAFEFKVNYKSEGGKKILNLLGRMDESLKQAAIKRANLILKDAELPTAQIDYDLVANKNGELILTKIKNLNMTQLDAIKKALSHIAYKSPGVPQVGSMVPGMSELAIIAQRQRKELADLLKGMNPEYRKALKLGQDKITRENALDVGAMALDTTVKRGHLKRALEDAGDAELEMAQTGLRLQIDDILADVKATINSPEIDLNKMSTLLKTLSSDSAGTKIKLILGDKKALSVTKMLDMAEAALSLRASVQKGSQTAVRSNVLQRISERTDSGVVNRTLGVQPVLAGREAIQALLQTKFITGKRKQIIMKELANALLGSKGLAARANFKILYKSVKNGETTQEQRLQIAEFLASKLTVSPANSATQLSEDTDVNAKVMQELTNLLNRQQ
mgnify:FL=1|jgi:hypothetical protein